MLARVGDEFGSLPAGSPRPLLVFLGDVIDRGPDSAKCLARICALRRLKPIETVLIKGNHEHWFSNFLSDAQAGPSWARFGGDATLRSYHVSPPGLEAPLQAWETARLEALTAVPPAHMELLRDLPDRLVEEDYLFVHAGVRPGRPLELQDPDDLLNIREEFLSSTNPSPYIVVHGHTPAPEPELLPWRIGVDTGAWASGRLSAAMLAGVEQSVIEVRGAPGPEPVGGDRRTGALIGVSSLCGFFCAEA